MYHRERHRDPPRDGVVQLMETFWKAWAGGAIAIVVFLALMGASPLQNPTDFTASVGTAGADATVTEYLVAGDDGTIGALHVTNIFIAAGTSVVTTPDAESLAQGLLIYTFPAGTIVVKRVYGDFGLDINDALLVGDTPEVGLGTLIASGAAATLGAVGAAAEDIWGPHVAAGVDTEADATDAGQFITVPNLIIPGASAHLVHFNVAAVWTDGAGTADVTLVNGARFIIEWYLLPIEGV